MKSKEFSKMSDAELSQKLGRYQRAARLWTIIGLIGVVSAFVCAFAVSDPALKSVLIAALFFGGVCCALFLGGGAQKKLKALMNAQLGDFFAAELEGAFGVEWHSPELRIDERLIKNLRVLDNEWEELEQENFREGAYRGVGFSAANVRLNHVYERGVPQDGLETCRDMIFKGLVIRAKTRTGAELTPQLSERISALSGSIEGQVLAIGLENDVLSLALETDYGFASVASSVDLRDLDALRGSYRRSLEQMRSFLDLLFESTGLFDAK